MKEKFAEVFASKTQQEWKEIFSGEQFPSIITIDTMCVPASFRS